MLIYAMKPGGTEAVTIGRTSWLSSSFEEMAPKAIIGACAPHQTEKLSKFNSYIERMGGEEAIILQVVELPEGCKRHRGFWEETFNERPKGRKG